MQRGNALFLILIAVALFAALSYAITQSGRGGGDISKEQTKLYAAAIMQAEGEIEQSYHRMIIIMSTPAGEIQVGDPPDTEIVSYGYGGSGSDFCTTGTTCLFAPEGGGTSIPQLPREAFDLNNGLCTGGGGSLNCFGGPTDFNGVVFIGMTTGGVALSNVGTGAADGTLQFYPLKKEVCEEINKALGHGEHIHTWPVDHDTATFPTCVGNFQGEDEYSYIVPLIVR